MADADYQTRLVDKDLDELLPGLPAIALEGPKGVGKTATARRRASTVYALDDPTTRELFAADPARIRRGERPILIDEWQLAPSVWDVVRRAVDEDATSRFLLTGSAGPQTPPTHSGAGRIVQLRMRPLGLSERGMAVPTVSLATLLRGTRPPIEGETPLTLADYTEEILASGFPGLRALAGRARRTALESYVARVVDREVPEQGRSVRRPATLRSWLAAYAAATATTSTWETIRGAATGGGEPPTRVTTQYYRDVLERLWLLDPVPGWAPSRNRIHRLALAPKHHLADPALAAVLLGLDAGALMAGEAGGPDLPRDGSLLGHLFESLVTLSVQGYAQSADARVGHLRTKGGREEVDLIVERRDQRVLGLEVKLAAQVTDDDVRHLRWLQTRLQDELLDAVVLTTGRAAYRRPDGIAVVPAVLLGP